MKSFFAIIGFIAILNCAGIGYLCTTHKNLEKRVKNIEFVTENRTVEPFGIMRPPFKYDNWIFQVDSLRRAIDLRDMKQQYYLTQMSIQSDWFIIFVTVLFGVFAIVGYGFFVAHTQALAKQYKEQKKIQEEHFRQFNERFKKTEADIFRVVSGSTIFQGNYCTEKGAYRSALKLYMDAAGFLFHIKELDESEESINTVNTSIWNILRKCHTIISKMYDKIEPYHHDFTFFFTSSESKTCKKTFNDFYAKVDDSSREEIKKIINILEQGIEKGEEIRKRNNAESDTTD